MENKKQGTVLLIGRPNVGKSTFLNNVIGTKVAITSPKPQTTRFPIHTQYIDERGRIIFIDTPGIFAKAPDYLAAKVNQSAKDSITESVDVILYMVDHTRSRDMEESKVLGIVRKIDKPKILVINKIDKQDKSFLPQYEFLKEEVDDFFEISALKRQHIKPLIDKIFEYLPETKEEISTTNLTYPLLNVDSITFIAELIREKVFLMMGEEIPYTATVVVDEITERNEKLTYIKARILTTADRYKAMIIGKSGRKIKEIGAYARKEIELATSKKIFLDLKVEVDPNWQTTYF
ncbi:MAG: GTPase Era [Patescibacteria group bacterium]